MIKCTRRHVSLNVYLYIYIYVCSLEHVDPNESHINTSLVILKRSLPSIGRDHQEHWLVLWSAPLISPFEYSISGLSGIAPFESICLSHWPLLIRAYWFQLWESWIGYSLFLSQEYLEFCILCLVMSSRQLQSTLCPRYCVEYKLL